MDFGSVQDKWFGKDPPDEQAADPRGDRRKGGGRDRDRKGGDRRKGGGKGDRRKGGGKGRKGDRDLPQHYERTAGRIKLRMPSRLRLGWPTQQQRTTATSDKRPDSEPTELPAPLVRQPQHEATWVCGYNRRRCHKLTSLRSIATFSSLQLAWTWCRLVRMDRAHTRGNPAK